MVLAISFVFLAYLTNAQPAPANAGAREISVYWVWVVALAGTFISYLLGLTEYRLSQSAIFNMFPRLSAQGRERAAFVLFLFVGTVIGMVVGQPTNYPTALSAGLGWATLIDSVRARAEAPRV